MNKSITFCSGFPTWVWNDATAHVQRVTRALSRIKLPDSPSSNFTPKVNLRTELIKDYGKPFPPEFWDTFPTNHVSSWLPVSYMSSNEWQLLADEIKYPSMGNVEWIRRGIERGFSIGCRGTARWPLMTNNHKTAITYGPQLVDTMATWMSKKLAAGPYELHELPWSTEQLKQSPISVALKPTGRTLSSPNNNNTHTDHIRCGENLCGYELPTYSQT